MIRYSHSLRALMTSWAFLAIGLTMAVSPAWAGAGEEDGAEMAGKRVMSENRR